MSKIMNGTVSDLESKVIDALDKLCHHPEERSWKNTGWTRQVKKAIIQLAHDAGQKAYASQVEKPVDGGEWLYDLVWLDYSSANQVLTRAILVLESEWSSDRKEIYRDFDKLLLARADLRLMVFEAQNNDEWQDIIDYLKKLVKQYEQSEDGDRYLFSGWIRQGEGREPRTFHHLHYVHGVQ